MGKSVLAVDVGSNAIRSALANVTPPKTVKIIEQTRSPVRLGHDAFSVGEISEEYVKKTVQAFEDIQMTIERHTPDLIRAVATSALREASNRNEVIDKIFDRTGIQVELIGGEEEARLIFLAVSHKIFLKNKLALLFDIGGGSVEVSISCNGEISASETFPLGTVRMLHALKQDGGPESHLVHLVDDHFKDIKNFVKENSLGEFDACVGTGGNVRCFGRLRKQLLNKTKTSHVFPDEAKLIRKQLLKVNYDKRVSKYGLRKDRADVIIPASLVIERILQLSQAPVLFMPDVGLKDGVFYDFAQEMPHLITN